MIGRGEGPRPDPLPARGRGWERTGGSIFQVSMPSAFYLLPVVDFDLAVVPVRLSVRPGGEVERVRGAGSLAVAEAEALESVDGQEVTMPPQEAREVPVSPGSPAIGVDFAIAKVANEQAAAEPAEVLRRHREAPRRIQDRVRRDPRDEISVLVELANEAVPDAGNVVDSVLLRVRDEDRLAPVGAS